MAKQYLSVCCGAEITVKEVTYFYTACNKCLLRCEKSAWFTTNKPLEDGWYWWQDANSTAPVVLQVYLGRKWNHVHQHFEDNFEGRWQKVEGPKK